MGRRVGGGGGGGGIGGAVVEAEVEEKEEEEEEDEIRGGKDVERLFEGAFRFRALCNPGSSSPAIFAFI